MLDVEVLRVPTWRSLALRGAISLAFGVGAFVWPGMSLPALVAFFAAYSLLDGAAAVAAATRGDDRAYLWLFGAEGLIGIAIGLGAFARTDYAARVAAGLIGLWAIQTGLFEIAAAVRLRRDIPGEVLMYFAGCVAIVLGVLALGSPGAKPIVLVALLGTYALFFGTVMLLLAFRIRRLVLARERVLHELGVV